MKAETTEELSIPGFFARWRQRRLERKIRHLSLKLDLDTTQETELKNTLLSLQTARHRLRHWHFETGRQLAIILRNPEMQADVLKTEIDLSIESLQSDLDTVSEQLVSLVAQLNNEQRIKLADLLSHRAYPRAA